MKSDPFEAVNQITAVPCAAEIRDALSKNEGEINFNEEFLSSRTNRGYDVRRIDFGALCCENNADQRVTISYSARQSILMSRSQTNLHMGKKQTGLLIFDVLIRIFKWIHLFGHCCN